MDELSPFPLGPRAEKATVRAARVAGAQWGVIGGRQLRDCGVSEATARRWHGEGKLHRIHPGVYALGHPSIPVEGRMVAALIRGGRDAVLSHATAAWWWGLIAEEPKHIDISAPARARSGGDVRVHHPRHVEATRHRRFPITTVARTLLDFAAESPLSDLRRALAEADYRRRLDVHEIEAVLGHGRPGAAQLRRALATHQPRLARTRSPLERRFLELCERARIPLPEINVRIGRMTVDAVWRVERLAVELDGGAGHSTRAQMERDRRRELHLRAHGFAVVRYTERQLDEQPELVIADLRAQLSPIARSA